MKTKAKILKKRVKMSRLSEMRHARRLVNAEAARYR